MSCRGRGALYALTAAHRHRSCRQQHSSRPCATRVTASSCMVLDGKLLELQACRAGQLHKSAYAEDTLEVFQTAATGLRASRCTPTSQRVSYASSMVWSDVDARVSCSQASPAASCFGSTSHHPHFRMSGLSQTVSVSLGLLSLCALAGALRSPSRRFWHVPV